MSTPEKSKDGAYFWMGLNTLKIPMVLYSENRSKFVKQMQEEGTKNGFALFQGGKSVTRYDTDHEDVFRQESFFSYLFGVTEPDFYGAIDIATGKSTLFIPRLPAAYAVWLGKILDPPVFKAKYEVDDALYVDELPNFLKQGEKKGEIPSLVYLLQGLNTDSSNVSTPAHFEGLELFTVDKEKVHSVLTECRVTKSERELNVMRYVNRVSSAAHVEVMRMAKARMMEYQMEAKFLHFVYNEAGCRHCAYTCICATGENSSVLHYGHAAAPNDKTVEEGDMALLDMGAEYNCYCSDITCSFPVNGKFTEDQSLVYGAVLGAQKAVMEAMKPGVHWVDMHMLAERTILEHLKKGGVLTGDVDEMMEKYLGAVFMPHGLGHFLGLDTHDVGGYPKGVSRVERPGLRSLRTARKLEEGMVITVEPGCYFIDTLIDEALNSKEKEKFFVKKVLERFRGSGGVRLEDDVIVTTTGIENMTLCPREIADVEAVMAGRPWEVKLL